MALLSVAFLSLLALVNSARVLLIGESSEQQLVSLFEEAQSSTFQISSMVVNHEADEAIQNSTFCAKLASLQISAIIDLSWRGWYMAEQQAKEAGVPYLKVEVSNAPFVEAADNFLHMKGATDAALIFESEKDLDQSLYFIIGNYELRVLVLSLDDPARDPYERLSKLRPIPTAYAAFGSAQGLSGFVNEASKKNLIKRNSRWNIFVEDFAIPNTGSLEADIVVATLSLENCCGLKVQPSSQSGCNCSSGTRPKQMMAKSAGQIVSRAIQGFVDTNYQCSSKANGSGKKTFEFIQRMKSEVASGSYKIDDAKASLYYPLKLNFDLVPKKGGSSKSKVGTWNPDSKMVFTYDFVNQTLPRILRVGMNPSAPWLFFKKDAKGEKLRDAHGNFVYDGYCHEFLLEIASRIGFEYEIVLSSDWQRSGYEYGKKFKNGTWTGLIGDLASGEVDLVVADLTMTSEREEIIDFVSPYFDQAGISIVLRKEAREQSLFKFLHVLKPEVWLGISAAVFLTALLIWFLDKYSPYSGRNNKDAYPEPCREFTLRESLWYALTTLTPQGGGEGPKSLSGRVLTSAYWLFVVLMLATFTANLAAFLTIERMQTNIQGLDELARQSKINYTVVSRTPYLEYFENMASAEEELYLKWKELSLNASDNPSKYRVWDYPIREQYTHILQVIKDTGPVESFESGFKQVKSHTKGDFALIHDAAVIRYEVYNDCDLIEIGEPFAEQPYALAVQQGSHLQELLSKVILELQKDRYFETLQGKYWNSSKKDDCPVLDDSEGITLQSLGGVFIATLIGLAIAMATLVVEVYMQRKNKAIIDPKKGANTYDIKIGEKQLTWTMPKVE